MKALFIFTFVFAAAGICSLAAQDLIVLRDGGIIEAKVLEIAPLEIRYKRFDHLDGPTIVIPAGNVLSIRYENGRVETINTAPAAGQEDARQSETTAIDPDKFIFGINANLGGLTSFYWYTGGPSVNLEFGKGNFNSEINLIIPWRGFGFLATFNYFWHSRLGGAYFGGGIGYLFAGYYPYFFHSLPIGVNAGYKFVTSSGLYFRTGAFFGVDFGLFWNEYFRPVYFKPELAIGWTMK